MKKVSLFVPCFVDQMYPETGLATVSLLEKYGCEVFYPKEQTCCGQPAFNSGYFDEAAQLAEKFVKIFADSEAVVAPSASCVSMVRKHYESLEFRDKALRAEYESLRKRVFEIGEYLYDELEIKSVESKFSHRVAYHASCHGYRELGILEQPLSLLNSVDGIDLVELNDRKQCCGFGGTFAVKFPEISGAIGEDKVLAILESKAEVVTATDDSCLMHIHGMMAKRGIKIKTMHYSRILNGEEF